jgi:hypothetical protein
MIFRDGLALVIQKRIGLTAEGGTNGFETQHFYIVAHPYNC